MAVPTQVGSAAGAAGVDVINAYKAGSGAVTALDTMLGSTGFGALANAEHIPFLGEDLSQGVDPFGTVKTELTDLFDGILVDGGDPVLSLMAQLDNAKAGLPAGMTISDYRFDCGGACNTVGEIQSSRIKLTASGEISGSGAAFSLPLPGIDFDPQNPPAIDVKVPWEINVDLVSDGGGVRVEEAAGEHEIALTDMALTVDAQLSAEVGPLRLDVTPVGTPGFTGTVTVDFTGSNVAAPSFDLQNAKVDARWDLDVATGSPLLGLSAQLQILWDLSGGSIDPDGLSITLADITLNAKELLGESLTDVLSGIADVVDPIHSATQPFITPIPGLSDLTDAAADAGLDLLEPSILGIAEISGVLPPGVRTAVHGIDTLHKGLSLATEKGDVPMGSLTLVGGEALSANGDPITTAMNDLLDDCTECKAVVDTLKGLVNAGGGAGGLKFEFPILEEPEILGRLLLGRDVDLITFDTGDTLKFTQPIDVPLFSVFIFDVELHGEVTAGIRLKGGYDTAGVRAAMEGGGIEELINGIYLEDPGEPVVRLASTVGLEAKAGFPAIALEAGVGVVPNLNIKLVVPPGARLRPFADLGGIGCSLLKDPTAAAEFDLVLNAFVRMPGPIPDIEHQITSINFLSKEDICDPGAKPPVLGEVKNGILEIIPGSQRTPALPADEADAIRVSGELDAQGALQTIVLHANGGAQQKFPIAGINGVSYKSPAGDLREVQLRVVPTDNKPFDRPVTVTTEGGKDFVSLELAAGRTSVVDLKGGDDGFVGGPGTDQVRGGGGADRIAGLGGPDKLFGDAGNDVVGGDDGVDEVWGGSDDDNLSAGKGAGNVVVGEEGKDRLLSGEEGDLLYGDERVDLAPDANGSAFGDADIIVTGGGADRVFAGWGADLVVPLSADIDNYDHPPADAVGAYVVGNAGADTLLTGDGGDQVWGGPDDDIIKTRGGDDQAWGGTGEDDIDGGDGADRLYGDRGADTCAQDPSTLTAPAETATGGAGDTLHGGEGDDQLAGEDGDDVLDGFDGDDRLCGHAGEDTADGGRDDDTAWGGSGDDTLEGDRQVDALYGGPGADTADGQAGNDLVLGQAGDDLDLRGGGDDDHIEGGPGADTAHGGDGDDDILGGSSPAFVLPGATTESTGDVGDTLLSGGDGHDVIVGDNGEITRTGGVDANNGAPGRTIALREAATVGGGDLVDGDGGDDALFGGAGADTVEGGLGDDHAEGNAAGDSLYGLAATIGTASGRDQDDLIGGSSAVNPDTVRLDAADTIRGDLDRDVVIGDNGEIQRPLDASGLWLPDPITGGVLRTVVLADRALTGADLVIRSGGDHVEGGDSLDRIFGQGGDDYLEGNEADDQVEGDQGSDRLEGNDGDDDLIGGSSLLSAPGVGDPDAADRIAGGAGADVLLGDNGAVARAATPSGTPYWDSVTNTWLGFASRRSVTLHDLASLSAGRFGADELSGGAGPDVLFGQDDDDDVFGGPADDYMEGNGGADDLQGDALAPPTGDARESAPLLLDGPAGADGQDDQIGGSSRVVSTTGQGAVTGHRDAADTIRGGGAADVQLGDNGRAVRRVAAGAYVTRMAETQRPTIVRQAALAGGTPTALPARFDVGAGVGSGRAGADSLYGDGGDDIQLGEEGDDTIYGGGDDDEMYGELGADRMYGEAGEDAMLGDRGVITNRLVGTPGTPFSISSVPQMAFTPFAAHPYDRRVDMSTDGDGAPIQSPGISTGGADLMRGGDDHDSLHGQAGNDVMNGDSGGDYLFGADGVDALWGGKGKECADPLDMVCNGDRGANDRYVDVLFGGRGLTTDPVTGGADLLDYRPRPGIDPALWFEATDTEPGDATAVHQHHQGVDWLYGGYDRDILQGDLAQNGPNPGDRLIDWTGAFNLYTHCNSAYGGWNDIRVLSPDMQDFLERLAFALGAGATLQEVQTAGTSGFNELALVRSKDVKANSGSAFPGTPGHYEAFSCAP